MGPTARQLEVLRTVQCMTDRLGYPPTIRELCSELGITVNALLYRYGHVTVLRRKGLLMPADGLSRSMVLADRGRALIGMPPRLVTASGVELVRVPFKARP